MTNPTFERKVDAGWDWLPEGEPITGRSYRADGWVYRDLPRMTPEFYDKLIDLIGDENIAWLTKADYGDSKRGQVLISPAGMARIHEANVDERRRKESIADAYFVRSRAKEVAAEDG